MHTYTRSAMQDSHGNEVIIFVVAVLVLNLLRPGSFAANAFFYFFLSTFFFYFYKIVYSFWLPH